MTIQHPHPLINKQRRKWSAIEMGMIEDGDAGLVIKFVNCMCDIHVNADMGVHNPVIELSE